MEEKKIKVESLISATVRVSNAGDASRTYGISAQARIENGRVNAVTEGMLSVGDADPMEQTASFNSWEGSRLSVELPSEWPSERKCEALSAIEAFIADCKAEAGNLV